MPGHSVDAELRPGGGAQRSGTLSALGQWPDGRAQAIPERTRDEEVVPSRCRERSRVSSGNGKMTEPSALIVASLEPDWPWKPFNWPRLLLSLPHKEDELEHHRILCPEQPRTCHTTLVDLKPR